MDEPVEGYYLGTRNHLLVTQSFTARGEIIPCGGRLADHLRNVKSPVLLLRDVEIRPHVASALPQTYPEARLAVDEILLAHEYVALRGDPHLRAMHEEVPPETMRLILATWPPIFFEGRVSSTARDWQSRFLVLHEPTFLISEAENQPIESAIQGLPYVLVNRDRVSAMMTLEEPS